MIAYSYLWVVLPQCHVSLLSVMLGSFDTDVFVSGMILQVSKIGWVRVCLMKFAFAFPRSYRFYRYLFLHIGTIWVLVFVEPWTVC
jgi:hypothetical protein